jgi:opacity protein-like surface antigen
MKNTNMRSLGLAGIILLLVASTAHAGGTRDGLYAGVALVGSGFVVDSGNTTDDLDGGSNISGGIYAGYKHRIFHGVFAAGETFFHDSSQDKSFSGGDKIDIDSQYGLKAHLGYEWDWGLVYSIIGAAHLGYTITQNDVRQKDNSFRPLLGAGITYQFTQKISTNFEYINTSEKINIAGDKNKDLSLMTLRLGVSYHF